MERIGNTPASMHREKIEIREREREKKKKPSLKGKKIIK